MRCAPLRSPALRSPALRVIYPSMTTTGPRATTQLSLQKYASQAIDERWTASQLAQSAGCSQKCAEQFLRRLEQIGSENTKRNVIALADSYRSTLELTAARSREYLQSISHLELDALDKDQRSLRKDALSSLSSLSSMLRLEITGDSSAAAPPRLGNL